MQIVANYRNSMQFEIIIKGVAEGWARTIFISYCLYKINMKLEQFEHNVFGSLNMKIPQRKLKLVRNVCQCWKNNKKTKNKNIIHTQVRLTGRPNTPLD